MKGKVGEVEQTQGAIPDEVSARPMEHPGAKMACWRATHWVKMARPCTTGLLSCLEASRGEHDLGLKAEGATLEATSSPQSLQLGSESFLEGGT